MLPLIAAAVDPDSREPAVAYLMSPTAVAVLMLMALALDYMTVGPAWLRDRLAFLFALVAIREGFNGSPIDRWTLATLTKWVQFLLDQTNGAYIAGASINVVLGCLVGLVGIYTIGALLPASASKKLGRYAAIKFPTSPIYRLNTKLWVCAIALGLLLDLPGGIVGSVLRTAYYLDLRMVSPLPDSLFGGA